MTNVKCPYCGDPMCDIFYDEVVVENTLIHLYYTCECGRQFTRSFEYSETRDEDGSEVTE